MHGGCNSQSGLGSVVGGSEPCLQQQQRTHNVANLSRGDFPSKNTPLLHSSGYQLTPSDNVQRQPSAGGSNASLYALSPASVSSSSYPTPHIGSQTPYPALVMRDDGPPATLNQR